MRADTPQSTSNTPDSYADRFQADPQSVRAALRDARQHLAQYFRAEDLWTLELILAEIFNNIVEHAYHNVQDGMIALTTQRHGKLLICKISDHGSVLPPDCLNRLWAAVPRPDPKTLPEGGFGWFLIGDLTHNIRYERHDGQNHLIFDLPITPIS